MDLQPTKPPAEGQTVGDLSGSIQVIDPLRSALGDVIDQQASSRSGLHYATTPFVSLAVREKDQKIQNLERKLDVLAEKYDKCHVDLNNANLKLAAYSGDKVLSLFKVGSTVLGASVFAIGIELYKTGGVHERMGTVLISIGVVLMAAAELGVLWRGFKK